MVSDWRLSWSSWVLWSAGRVAVWVMDWIRCSSHVDRNGCSSLVRKLPSSPGAGSGTSPEPPEDRVRPSRNSAPQDGCRVQTRPSSHGPQRCRLPACCQLSVLCRSASGVLASVVTSALVQAPALVPSQVLGQPQSRPSRKTDRRSVSCWCDARGPLGQGPGRARDHGQGCWSHECGHVLTPEAPRPQTSSAAPGRPRCSRPWRTARRW